MFSVFVEAFAELGFADAARVVTISAFLKIACMRRFWMLKLLSFS